MVLKMLLLGLSASLISECSFGVFRSEMSRELQIIFEKM